MLKGVGDLFFLGGVGEDIFGETYAARIAKQDPENKYLTLKLVGEYINWHKTNHRFYDNYESDMKKMTRLGYMK